MFMPFGTQQGTNDDAGTEAHASCVILDTSNFLKQLIVMQEHVLQKQTSVQIEFCSIFDDPSAFATSF